MKIDREQRAKFIEMYEGGATYAELSAMFGISERYASTLRQRLGLQSHSRGVKPRQTPADFADVVKTHGISKARKIFNASWCTVYRWAEEAGLSIQRKKPEQTRPMKVVDVPADWAETAPTMYKFELAEHYGISILQVRRLIEKTGVRSRMTRHELAKLRGYEPVKAPKAPNSAKRYLCFRQPPIAVNDNMTVYDMAANFLRRHYPNVFRCDIRMFDGKATTWGAVHGVPNGGRDHYYVGARGPVHKDQMIEIARERGFKTGLEVAA